MDRCLPSTTPARRGAKLLTRDPALLARPRRRALRQPRVTRRAVADPGEPEAPPLDARALVDRAAPRIAALAAVQPAQHVLVPRAAQRRERRRVAPALGEAVPAEAERVRPPPQPQLAQMRLAAQPPRALDIAAHVIAHPQAREVAGAQADASARRRPRWTSSRTSRCTPAHAAASPASRRQSSGRTSQLEAPPDLRARARAGSSVGGGERTRTRARPRRAPPRSSSSHENSAAGGSTRSADSRGCARSSRITQ